MRLGLNANGKRAVQAQFVEGLSTRRRQQLLRRCASEPKTAAAYQNCAQLEQRLCGEGSAPTVFAIERMLQVILAERGTQAVTSSRYSWQPWAFTGMALAGAMTVLLWVLPARMAVDHAALPVGALFAPVELTEPPLARGGALSRHAQSGIRLLRVASDREQVGRAQALTRSDWITFTYTNVEPGLAYLALCGVQDDGQIRWYYPDYGGTQSVAIAADVVDEPLGDGIDLSVHHESGPLQILAVFSRTPLSADVVAAEARRLVEVSPTPEAFTLEQKAPGSVFEHWLRVIIATEGANP